jgi:hypothetical protein
MLPASWFSEIIRVSDQRFNYTMIMCDGWTFRVRMNDQQSTILADIFLFHIWVCAFWWFIRAPPPPAGPDVRILPLNSPLLSWQFSFDPSNVTADIRCFNRVACRREGGRQAAMEGGSGDNKEWPISGNGHSRGVRLPFRDLDDGCRVQWRLWSETDQRREDPEAVKVLSKGFERC